MKEKTLIKTALICAIIGVIALFIISGRISIDEQNIEKITTNNVGESIRIKGEVYRATDTGKVIFLDVGQEKVEKVTIILFKDRDVSINVGDRVEIIGEIEEYNGELEIIANEVKLE